MKKGLFITFEGTDGVGKSTQLRLCEQYLIEKGHDIIITREPGGCDISEQIRAVILDKKNIAMSPECEALLYAAARAQHMSEVILPALEAGKTVICDRFYDSSMAYQGFGRMLGEELVSSVNEPALYGRLPDLTILLSLPPEKAFERKHGEHDDRIEISGDAFFERVYKGFNKIAADNPDRVCLIEATGSIEETFRAIKQVLKQTESEQNLSDSEKF